MNIAIPKRKKHSCTQTWSGGVESVFPLLCPVKEAEWIPDWKPSLVISKSGVMEKNCVFLEPSLADARLGKVWIFSAFFFNTQIM